MVVSLLLCEPESFLSSAVFWEWHNDKWLVTIKPIKGRQRQESNSEEASQRERPTFGNIAFPKRRVYSDEITAVRPNFPSSAVMLHTLNHSPCPNCRTQKSRYTYWFLWAIAGTRYKHLTSHKIQMRNIPNTSALLSSMTHITTHTIITIENK